MTQEVSILDKILSSEPLFRKKQVDKAIFQDLVDTWSDVTTIPLTLRDILENEFPLSINSQEITSKEGDTTKALITFNDNLSVETVLMRHKDERNTLCVSSEVGCPLNCSFCITGQMGFKRNLTEWEIVSQYLYFARKLKKENKRITNVVFMGMGEPFLNYENVLRAIRIINDKEKIGLGARHISVSTVGIPDGIRKFAGEDLEVNLALSLHAADDKLRSELMPINNKYDLQKVMDAIDFYIEKTNRRVMIEYIMIKGVNDSPKNARHLAELLKKKLVFINLISYNRTGFFAPSETGTIEKFEEILKDAKFTVTRRFRFGDDISAACGQLASERK